MNLAEEVVSVDAGVIDLVKKVLLSKFASYKYGNPV